MSTVLETLILFLVKQILTPELIKHGEKALVEFLKKLAADSRTKVDDYMVEVIAEALGVEL